MGKVTKPPAEDHLTMNLFAPGMSALHRVGLGGLACTLKAMERQLKNGLLAKDKLPRALDADMPLWEITGESVTLWFGKPENASEYLKKLFAFAFQIKDGLIYLPGQYADLPPSLAVRAEMQTALSRTFLQGAKKNVGLESASPYLVDPDGSGTAMIEIAYQKCKWYLHQQVWKVFIDDESLTLLDAPKKKIDGKKNVNFGSLYPGAIKRHDIFSESDVTETIKGLLCSLFFLVGCFAVRLGNSGDGVLLVPDVQKLEEFSLDRPFMTPQTVAEVRVGGLADAAYQAELRLRTRCLLMSSSIPSCRAVRFSLRTWTKPQKSRTDAVDLMTDEVTRFEPETPTRAERSFSKFERAMAFLPRGVRIRKDESTYWSDSLLRPFLAENLALDNPWYSAFIRISKTPAQRKQLSYERREILNMIADDSMFDEFGEKVVVRAVHAALFVLRGKIAKIYEDRPKLKFEKFEDEREKWARAFAGAMTMDQFRKRLADMFRRAGSNSELQESWELLLPMLRRNTWQQARDLALIGLCSYQGREKPASADKETNPL